MCGAVVLMALLAVGAYVAAAIQVGPEKAQRSWSRFAQHTAHKIVHVSSQAWTFTTFPPAKAEPVAAPKESRARTPPPAAARVDPPRYHCVKGSKAAQDAAAVLAEWVATDRDKSNLVSRAELMQQKATLSSKSLERLLDADGDGDGSLSRQEFTSALVQSKRHGGPHGLFYHPADVHKWSHSKRTWCCENAGIGCFPTTTRTTTTTATMRYDCMDMGDGWEQRWTSAKKEWCCRHAKAGCPHVSGHASNADVFACDRGDAGTWHALKRHWCCHNKHVGCGAGHHLDSHQRLTWSRSECSEGGDDTWPAKKKAFCCERFKTGCAPPVLATLDPVGDRCHTLCEVDGVIANCKDRVRWSAQHSVARASDSCERAYAKVVKDCPMCWGVCSVAEAGCGSDDELPADVGPQGAAAASAPRTPPRARARAPQDAAPAATPATAQTFQCEMGPDWRVGWSPAKQDWCCRKKRVGCRPAAPQGALPASAAPAGFDCGAGVSTWSWGWSAQKKTWCCTQFGKGCPIRRQPPMSPEG